MKGIGRNSLCLLALCSSIGGAVSPVSAQGRYSITDLGTLGGSASLAAGINEQGQIVGTADLISTGLASHHAFLYSGGVMSDLGVLGTFSTGFGTGSVSSGTAINNNGQIVGHSYTSNQVIHPFLYSGGEMSDLGVLPGGQEARAVAITDGGQIVGYSLVSGSQHAFLYEGGVMADLGSLGGGTTFAYGINKHGQIVGDSWTNSSGLSDTAFVYSNGIMTRLPNLGKWLPIQALAVNDNGQIVGYAGGVDTGGPTVTRGFLLSGGAMSDLGNLGGSLTNVVPSAINNPGQIVGTISGYQGPMHAFLYSGGVIQDLNNLIDPGSGWTLFHAGGINDNGQIVGRGQAPSGQTHAFLLTPRAWLQNLQLAGGSWAFSLVGMTGATYRVDYTPSLGASNWMALTNLVLPLSPYGITDVVQPSGNQRFYRAVQTQ